MLHIEGKIYFTCLRRQERRKTLFFLTSSQTPIFCSFCIILVFFAFLKIQVVLQDFIPEIGSHYRTYEDAFFSRVKGELLWCRTIKVHNLLFLQRHGSWRFYLGFIFDNFLLLWNFIFLSVLCFESSKFSNPPPEVLSIIIIVNSILWLVLNSGNLGTWV